MSDELVKRSDLLSAFRATEASFRLLSQAVSGLTVPTAVDLYLKVKEFEKVVEAYKELATEKLLGYTTSAGSMVTEKGTIEARIGDFTLRAQPWRTTLDPKKVEKLLRAKGKDPATYMNTKITYEADEKKLQGVFSPDEIELCAYDLKYILKEVKPIKEDVIYEPE